MKAPRRKKKKDGTEFIGDFQTSKMHSPHKKMRTYILSDEIELSKSIHIQTCAISHTQLMLVKSISVCKLQRNVGKCNAKRDFDQKEGREEKNYYLCKNDFIAGDDN